jgi:hypothetical protein
MAAAYNLTQLAADVTEIVQREKDSAKIVAAARPLLVTCHPSLVTHHSSLVTLFRGGAYARRCPVWTQNR